MRRGYNPAAMHLHLFSAFDIRCILDACRPYLEGKPEASVAYLPAASLSNQYQEHAEKAFAGLARLQTIDTELQTLSEMESILRSAALVYIPGGNTYLLNHRLHLCKFTEILRRKVAGGMPLVAFSAGAVLCEPNILTSNDLNIVPTTYFKGLAALPFNLNVHYPLDRAARLVRDDWLSEYHIFQDNPVLLLSDGAYVRVDGKRASLVRGEAWILRKGQEKQPLAEGKAILP